mgnify:CR=1 FL=1
MELESRYLELQVQRRVRSYRPLAFLQMDPLARFRHFLIVEVACYCRVVALLAHLILASCQIALPKSLLFLLFLVVVRLMVA